MCGLVGIFTQGYTNDKEMALFKGLLLVDQLRGEHATGVFKVSPSKNEVSVIKRATNAVDFLADEEVKEFLDKDKVNIYVGHNRYATMGDKGKHDNAHPFQADHITLVHNGGVDPFALDLLEGYTDPAVEVDSHMVALTIAKHGIEKAVKEHLSGAFALIWWDSKERTLNFIRNQDRPLWFAVTTQGAMVWASEKAFLDVFLERAGRASGYRMKPVMMEPNQHHKIEFTETGIRKGTGPVVRPMEFLEIAYPKPFGAAGADWWKDNLPSSTSQSQKANGNVVSIAASGSGSANMDNIMRVNDTLSKEGFRLRYGSLVTADVTVVDPYKNMKDFGRVEGVCRDTGKTVSAWGINLEDMEGVSVIRGNVKDCYVINKQDMSKQITIVLESVGVSCHDPKYSAERSGPLRTSASSTPAASTSRGSAQDDAAIAAAKIVEMRKNTENNARKKVVNLVNYPLKVQGHTFIDAAAFREFVSKGCAFCNAIPTAYDARNVSLTVYEGEGFNGLIEDCEFICGKCSEA